MSSGQGKKKDFFISYTSADRGWAEWIAWQLEQAGYSVVLQAWDFGAGSNFVLEMQAASAGSERTIAVLSPDYPKSKWAQPEWAAAFDPLGQRRTLVPVLVRECAPEGLLAHLEQVRLVGLEEAAAKAALLEAVRRGRLKPVTPPPYPAVAARVVAEEPRFPGALPPIWNVPHLRNPNFTGREELLEDLRRAFTSGGTASTQALVGLGGVGKTQLAVEYSYSYAAEYTLVWWLHAGQPATLTAEYATLAGELGLPHQSLPDQRLVAGTVRRWLEQQQGWLLVFDNAGGPAAVISHVPRGGGGHVLITSRNPEWGAVARVVPVRHMERAEAVGFLCRRAGQSDRDAAARVAEALGDLPLALEQAGAYIKARGVSFAAYLERFSTRREELWTRETPPVGYDRTVATTWSLSFEQVKKAFPAAAGLLRLCAFLAPNDIPRKLLGRGAGHLPRSPARRLSRPLVLDDAIGALQRYSLLEAGGNGAGGALSIHPLVQAVVRMKLSGRGVRWAAAAACLLNDAFPFDNDDVCTWPESARLVPHALAAARYARSLGAVPVVTAGLLNQVGVYLETRAAFTEARKALEEALGIREAVCGLHQPEVAGNVSNLGHVLQHLGDLAGARAQYERALKIDEAVYGANHPVVGRDLNNLGSVLQDLGDLAGARQHYERALAIAESRYGPNHHAVAIRVNNLGTVLQELGNLEGARALYERALRIAQIAYSPRKYRPAGDSAGSMRRAPEDMAEDRARLERAVKVDELACDFDHTQVARRTRVRPHHQPPSRDEVARDVDHPHVAPLLTNLGSVLHALGDSATARANYERALKMDEAAHGPNHPAVARDVNNLGCVLQHLGDLEEARRHYQRALQIDEAAYGPDNPRVAIRLHNLGSVLHDLGDLGGAREHYERALHIDETAYGPDHPKVATIRNNLGRVLRDQGDTAGARAQFSRALQVFGKSLGENHPHTLAVHRNLESLGARDSA